MYLKKIFLILIFITSSSLAHKVAGVDTTVEKLKNNQIHIKAFMQKSKKAIYGNQVRLISMFDNRVLDKGILLRDGLILNIPKESYWVFVLYRDNDIVKDGPAPKDGFKKAIKKEKVAFLYTLLISFAFIFLALFFTYIKIKKFKQSI